MAKSFSTYIAYPQLGASALDGKPTTSTADGRRVVGVAVAVAVTVGWVGCLTPRAFTLEVSSVNRRC